MKKTLFFTFLSVVLTSLFCGCNQKHISYDSHNDEYIQSVSGSMLGRKTPIVISFFGEALVPLDSALSFDREIKGKWNVSEDNKMAVFEPADSYKANSTFTLRADCARLFGTGSTPDYYKREFYVSNPEYQVQFDEVKYSDNKYNVTGSVTTDIPVTLEEVESVLSAKLSFKKQTVEWTKSENQEKWFFVIKDVPQGKKENKLKIIWSGRGLGLTGKQDKFYSGSKIITIPSIFDFSVVDINTSLSNMIRVSFSRSLDSAQDILPFINIHDKSGKILKDFTAAIRDNVLTLFSDSNFANAYSVEFRSGIKSSEGTLLAKSYGTTLSGHWNIPSVKFLNDSVILPTSQGTITPIETENLTGVIVQVYEIYDRTMFSFLQENELDNTRNIQRSGEPVWEKKISFPWNDSMQNQKIRRGIDLSEISKKYPGGMFHVRIGFIKSQIKYVCNSSHPDFDNLPQVESIQRYQIPTEKSNWDWWNGMDYDKRNSYWRYRNDPCHPAFYLPNYNSGAVIGRNILVSDIGLIAKKDVSNKLYVTASDLKTTKPLSGITIEAKSYVGTTIKKGRTDSNGTVVFDDTDGIFYIFASNGNQASYLKLSEGTNLSTSHFDIGGVKVEKGVKGFIYGERGVWRPGDSLFLTFVLQDEKNTLPKDIPVTFEFQDPLGKITETKLLKNNVNGFYPITASTNENCTTGLWTARVKIGGKAFTKSCLIETVVPNKLAVELNSSRKVLLKDDNKFELKGAWLHGAPVPNYKADVSVAFTQAQTTFKGFSEFTFEHPDLYVPYSRSTIWEGKLDSESKVSFDYDFKSRSEMPGMVYANLVSRIFEPSGAFSTQSKSVLLSPYDEYVGLKLPKGDAVRNMLLTDKKHTVELALVDSDGNPVNGTVEYAIYKLEWKWWWEKDAYTSATHVSSRYRSTITKGETNVKNGRGSFEFEIKYPEWGRYIVEVKDSNSSHRAGKIVYVDWPGWAGRAQEGGADSAAMIPLTAGKKEYSVGETAEVSFASNKLGRALITIEKAGEIIKQQWIETGADNTVYKFPVTADMAPNVYVHVTLVQPHLQTANSLPVRLYGVVPVMVDNKDSWLKPVITCAKELAPNAPATFSVSEENGKPMTYTIAVVDEGLLGLTNFHAPDIHSEFYKKEASLLHNWDIYKYVMSAYSGKLETILAVGGGDGAINDAQRNENRFAPVVRYFGPYNLGPGQKKATTFDMPNYVGAVRAIVIAGDKAAYGRAEKSVRVKSGLMVQPSVPRTLGTNESINIPVTVFNGSDSRQEIQVSFSARGMINFTKKDFITLDANANGTLFFPVSTKGSGPVNFVVTASSNGESAKSSVNVDVLSRGIPVVDKVHFTVSPKSTETVQVLTPSEKNTAQLKVELSSLPVLDLSERLEYLTGYPHGCIEQITSGGFPQIYLPKFVKMTSQEVNRCKDNVNSVIERYSNYQISTGAMGYWPGNQYPHEWGTCYACHFMLEARNNGFNVPEEKLKPALDYIKNMAENWTENSGEASSVQAYRLYVLELAKIDAINSMNRIVRSDMPNDAKLLLSAAYAISGRKPVAKTLLQEYVPSTNFFRQMGGEFSSSTREQALYLFTAMNIDDSKTSAKIAKQLANRLSDNKWLSTQETAWALMGLMPYYMNLKGEKIEYKITANQSSPILGVSEDCTVVEKLDASTKADSQTVAVQNNSSATLFGVATCSGMSVAGEEKSKDEGIKMIVEGIADLARAKSGEEVIIKVKITNRSERKLENLALTVPVPTCVEFTNERVASEGRYRDSSFTYQDIKDTAIYTYFDLERGAVATFNFRGTVAFTGDYYIPAIHCEAMYDDSIGSVYPGRLVKMNTK
ncbi:MAG: alpha-2-macroglobulin [Treponema sp.]|nr:alpha-2-macroglobulin [Treponema sp.]